MKIEKSRQLERDKVDILARRGLGTMRGLNLRGADGFESPIGRIVIAPTEEPISSEKELEKGVTIGGVYLEQAPPEACVADGAYSVKLLKERGNWKAQLIQKDKVMTSIDNIKVVRFEGKIERPIVMFIEPTTVVICLVAFAVGFIVGASLAVIEHKTRD
jgi:hypothetical protein